MPRGVSKDPKHFKEILDKGVILVAGDGDVIDLDDPEPVRVAVMFDVNGFGPHVGAIYAMQRGHVDEALQAADELLEEWTLEKYPESADNEHFTETFDGFSWTLSPEDFADAIEGTSATKFIETTEEKEEETEAEEGVLKEGRVSEHNDAIQVTIDEKGNGFPDVGDFVRGDDGNLYEVVSLGRIHTGQRSGASNYIHAEVVLADWDDVDEEDEFPAQVIIPEEDE